MPDQRRFMGKGSETPRFQWVIKSVELQRLIGCLQFRYTAHTNLQQV